MDLTEVKGIGPATAIKLQTGGIKTAESLAKKDPEQIILLGIGKATAIRIINNAKEIVGAPVEEPKEETKKEKPKKVAKPKKEEPKAVEPSVDEISVGEVAGVGPKTETTLEKSGITSASQLASSSIDDIVEMGIGKATAKKIITSAAEMLGVSEPEELVEEKPKKVKKPKKKKTTEEEHERSPMPQGIPTKKKRGFQIRSTEDDKAAEVDTIDKPEGWGVQAKRLSKDELDAKKRRQEEIARSRRITREIPALPVPVKAVKPKVAKEKGEKPVKIEKKAKKVKRKAKKKATVVEYYAQKDLYPDVLTARKRGISAKSGTSKPRIELERDTYLGQISSHRRSRRVIHARQVIVDLDEGFNPDQLVGQKVYFVYPDNEARVAGSVSKRFGKSSSGKVLVNFKKGIRMEGIKQKLFIK
ncbi:MAG: helix-hairpin-helix domain-containing protein [Candidatus Kariarchaeaceae archaeon]|jgi:predicted flap endonuclease-1-like 5' DNA nuclease/ribosomal protein L35AE/L33A